MTPQGISRGRVIMAILHVFITLPIWFFLLYQILRRVEATELMMFLYWVYVPIGITVGILSRVVETDDS